MKRDIFNEPISVYLVEMGRDKRGSLVRYSSKHFTRTIGRFLGAGEIYRDNIAAARKARAGMVEAACGNDMRLRAAWKLKYDDCKWLSPCAMIAGVSPDQKQFTSYSNVLCLDIDAPKPGEKDNGNAWVQDWNEVKKTISGLQCVSYCAISAGGAGVYALIPIADHAKHEQYFDTLSEMFARHLHLSVDKATRNINRLRFMTYDPAPYINHAAEVWDKVNASRSRPYEQGANRWKTQNFDNGATLTRMQKERAAWCAKYCIDNCVSITENYDDWVRVLAFFIHFWNDETGISIAHEIASLSPKYRPGENDKKLFNLAKHHPHPANLYTFMRICRDNGVPVPLDWFRGNPHRATIRPLNLERTENELRENTENQSRTKAAQNDIEQRARKEKNDVLTREEPVRKTPIAPPLKMSAGEQWDLDLHADYVAEGVAMVEALRANPAFDSFCNDFELYYCGHGDGANEWHMTAAQFENFWHERENAPVPF